MMFDRRTVGLCCVIVIMCTGRAHAETQRIPAVEQETPAAAVTQTEEVVVIATRNAVPKNKVTKSVSVVTEEQIRQEHAGTLLEALRNVPGIFVRQSGAIGRTTAIVIRGSTDDQVLVMIDGVEVNNITTGGFDYATLPAEMIERVEVLRGSASTLYGSHAIGGVVNIITKHGSGPMRTSIASEFGTNHTFRETVQTQAEVGPLSYHVGATRVDSHGLGEGDDVEITHANATSTLQLAPWARAEVAVNSMHSSVGIDDGAFRPDPNRFLERDQFIMSTALIVEPTDMWESELRFTLNDDDLLSVDVANPGTQQTTTEFRFNTTRVGGELINRIDFGTMGLLTIGGQVLDDEAESTSFRKTILRWAWYVQHQVDLTDRFTVIAGVRKVRHNTFGGHLTIEGSASYRVPGTETRLYANYSEGFRAPDLNELFFPGFGNPALKPEESEMFEVGVGQDFWDHRATIDLSFYHTEVDQLIQISSPRPFVFLPINLGEAEMEGFELAMAVRPTDALELRGQWTYTDAEEEPSKEELADIPQHVLGLNLHYRFHPKWRMNANATVVSRREASNRQKIKGYKKIDASITYEVNEHVEVYMRVENLLNARYQEVLGFQAAGAMFFVGGKLSF
jgi:vitamin B12 transporter